MLGKIGRHIESLIDKHATHIVALSGGADSVCLLVVMKQLGYTIEAAHCNFHLRGEESFRDQHFCESLCRKQGIKLHITHFDTTEYASLHKLSIETAARDLRYDYFERLRKETGAADICVAHHSDDLVETVLMNIIRGTGLNGLIGIRERNGNIVRPLLNVSRKDIIDYLEEIGQDYVTDSTNLIADATRNKLRLNIIPQLEDINPAVKDNILRMTEWLNDAETVVNDAVGNSLSDITTYLPDGTKAISLNALPALPSPRYALFTLLHPLGFTAEQVREISVTVEHGKLWQSKTHTAVIDRDCILIGKTPEKPCGSIEVSVEECVNISRNPFEVTLDADKVSMPLTLRSIEKGDRFVPFGMKGSKLVSDFLTDRKRNYFEKQRQQVVCDATGNIVWLVGERPDNRYVITGSTIKVLRIRYL